MTEMVDIVDEEDKVIGKSDIDDAVRRGKIFRVARIIVVNSEGRTFVHQRSYRMVTFPGCYDFGAAGIVSAGERYEETAIRELKEELDVEGVELKLVGDFKYRGETKTNNRIYFCCYDGPMKLQEEEIIHGRFMTHREIRELMQKENFHPGGVVAYEKYVELKK